MPYDENLKDPRWQKKRLEILQRDNWTCQLCANTTRTLHVHHKRYVGEIWDIDNEFLITYCKFCHQIVEHIKKIHNSLDYNPVKSVNIDSIISCVVQSPDPQKYTVMFFKIYDEKIIWLCNIPPEHIRTLNSEMDVIKFGLKNG